MKYTFRQKREQQPQQIGRTTTAVALITGSFCLMALSGCNGLPGSTAGPTLVPQTYMATDIGSTQASGESLLPNSYTIDDNANPNTFVQSTITGLAGSGANPGTTPNAAGNVAVLARGLRSLAENYNGKTTYPIIPLPGSYAVELAGQAGGLVQMVGQPATPLAAAQSCPDSATAQTFQFITLPIGLGSTGTSPSAVWNPATDTAYGSVSISGSGTTVNFSNIQQFTLPVPGVNGGMPGTPKNPSPSTVTGACSPTPYGNTISVPGALTITNPGGGTGTQSVAPSAIVGIGPTGLLVEWNGNNIGSYQNVLGAGTGAIGVPQPSSPLSTSDVVGAQYLGFIYGGGVGSVGTGSSSTLASFGFPTAPSTCSSVASQTSTLIYGGDFPSNDPTTPAVQSNGGYGNCDLAIDLGTQSATNNGLYPSATVWLGSTFSANATKKTYSMSAVAIVSQLQGKFVILVIGKDTTQAWSLYLMQSN